MRGRWMGWREGMMNEVGEEKVDEVVGVGRGKRRMRWKEGMMNEVDEGKDG